LFLEKVLTRGKLNIFWLRNKDSHLQKKEFPSSNYRVKPGKTVDFGSSANVKDAHLA